MKVQCPCCSVQIPASNINLETGWGKCEACHDLFRISTLVPGFSAAGIREGVPAQRPFNARAIVERTAEKLLVYVPPEGMRAGGCGLLGFATFWLGFIAFWTVGALGLFGDKPVGAFNWVFASFSIPFWIIGFGMMAGVAWAFWGTKSVQIDRSGMRTYQRCLAWSRSRWFEFESVQHARNYDPQVKTEGKISHAVEIVYRAGSFTLPSDSEEEKLWLIVEINSFVRELAVESSAAQ